MAFKSKAQMRWMYANKPETAKKWAKETPNEKDLPERKAANAYKVLKKKSKK